MKIKEITLKNYLGVREFNLSVDGPVAISGKNGTGKSSIIKGLQTIIGGGNMATLRNMDAPDDEPAEGVLVLEGEDGIVRIERDEKGVRVQEQIDGTQAYKDVKTPQRWLNRLYDAAAVNPVSILNADPKKRVDIMLEAIVFDHDSTKLWDDMGLKRGNYKIPDGLDPLKEIAKIREAIFDERTGVNRDEKNNNAAALEIRKSIPAEIPTVEGVEAKRDQLTKLRAAYSEVLSASENRRREVVAVQKNKIEALVVDQRHELVELEERLKREMAEKISSKMEWLHAVLKDAEAESQKIIDASDVAKNEEIEKADAMRSEGEELNAEIARLTEQKEDVVRITTLTSQADTHESKAREFHSFSRRLTAALDTLDGYKSNLCSSIPINGLNIDENGITVDEVPWNTVNTGRQIEVVVELALLRCKDKPLKIVFVDGAEALDTERRELLAEKIEAAEAQPFFATVQDCDLVAKSEGCTGLEEK